MAKNKKGLLLTQLKFEALAKLLGGALPVQWDKEARKAMLDCGDAPDCSKGRKVTLTAEFKPRLTPGGMNGRSEYAGCLVEFQIAGTIPGKSIQVLMKADDDGGLLFNPDAPEDPDQRTVQQAENQSHDDEDE